MQRLWVYKESYLATKKVLALLSDSDFPESTLLDSIQVVRSSLVPILRISRPSSSVWGNTRTCVGGIGFGGELAHD